VIRPVEPRTERLFDFDFGWLWIAPVQIAAAVLAAVIIVVAAILFRAL